MQHTLDGRGSETTNLLGYGTLESGTTIYIMKPLSKRKVAAILASCLLFTTYLGYIFHGYYNADEYQRLERRWKKEEIHRAIIREQWIEEEKMHELKRLKMSKDVSKWEEERDDIEADRKKWAQERLDEAMKKHEDEEKKRNDLVWDGLTPASRCLSYGTREYTATLSNVAVGLDPLVECAKKPISIHGKEILPSSCTLVGYGCGRVIGRWNVDFDEAACTPRWAPIVDKGCDTGMGSHRHEARLENLQSDEDWEILCKTTPTIIMSENPHFTNWD